MRNVARLIVKTAKRIRKKWITHRLLKADRLHGDRLPYYCPCCDTHFKRFVSNGYDRRPERYDIDRYRGRDQAVICPICGALPRHRILAFWMNDRVDDIRATRENPDRARPGKKKYIRKSSRVPVAFLLRMGYNTIVKIWHFCQE